MRHFTTFALLLLLPFLLAACAGMQRNLDQAPQGAQSIRMWHKASGERISVTYRVGGHYDADAFNDIDHLFRDRHTGEEYAIDPALIDVIADMRDKMMMDPDTEIELTSGYRSPESNDNLRKTNKNAAKNSYHTKGQAADIRIPGMIPSVLELVAKTMQRGGVALYPDSGHVHVDVGPVRGWEVKRGREEGSRNASAPSAARTPVTVVRSRTLSPVTGTVVPLPKKAGSTKVAPAVRVRSTDAPVLVKEPPSAAPTASGKKMPSGFSKTPYARPTVGGKPVGKAMPNKAAAKAPTVKTAPKPSKPAAKGASKPATKPAPKPVKKAKE